MALMSREGLLCAMKSVVSAFYGIILWPLLCLPTFLVKTTILYCSERYILLQGLKTLSPSPATTDAHQNRNARNPSINDANVVSSSPSSRLPPPPPPSPPPPSPPSAPSSSAPSSSSSSLFKSLDSEQWPGAQYPAMDDLIGAENGVYMMMSCPEHEIITGVAETKSRPSVRRRETWHRRCETARMAEYPPPIPQLGRAGEGPWDLIREYTSDGRLIIRMERKKNHRCMEAHRSHNRLVLKMFSQTDPTEYHNDDHNLEPYEDDRHLMEKEEEEEEETESEPDDDDDDDDDRMKAEEKEDDRVPGPAAWRVPFEPSSVHCHGAILTQPLVN
ncbi:uncharacterized protein LOC131162341 [Malania oleifera]|uniref:uncharacterized protein LOC131162341 n=1 Tax=Malania oleifera TaxID=397392 RepID=UPI0025ADB36A|nr:uncharacterized protein LOC131162341 [Malania oleifera]